MIVFKQSKIHLDNKVERLHKNINEGLHLAGTIYTYICTIKKSKSSLISEKFHVRG